MFETVVIATDGSESVERGVRVASDLAHRFDASVHALYVLDEDEIAGTPQSVRADVEAALRTAGDEALASVENIVTTTESGQSRPIETAVREGRPEREIIRYARNVDADVIAMGTRGRHGEYAYLLGSVAEAVVRHSPIPVLTVRQLEQTEAT